MRRLLPRERSCRRLTRPSGPTSPALAPSIPAGWCSTAYICAVLGVARRWWGWWFNAPRVPDGSARERDGSRRGDPPASRYPVGTTTYPFVADQRMSGDDCGALEEVVPLSSPVIGTGGRHSPKPGPDLSPRPDAQLLPDGFDVMLRRPPADSQPSRDLLVGAPQRDQLRDLACRLVKRTRVRKSSTAGGRRATCSTPTRTRAALPQSPRARWLPQMR